MKKKYVVPEIAIYDIAAEERIAQVCYSQVLFDYMGPYCWERMLSQEMPGADPIKCLYSPYGGKS